MNGSSTFSQSECYPPDNPGCHFRTSSARIPAYLSLLSSRLEVSEIEINYGTSSHQPTYILIPTSHSFNDDDNYNGPVKRQWYTRNSLDTCPAVCSSIDARLSAVLSS